jgi:hypothetical protein
MPKKPKGEIVPADGPIVISPIARPKTSRSFASMPAPSPIGAKPLNAPAAKAVVREAQERDRAERYLALCAIYNGDYVHALCEIEGVSFNVDDRYKNAQQQNIERNWWLMHREICSGTQHINEMDYTRELGGSRAARIAVLTRFMHAGSEQAAILAIRELNKMDEDMIESGRDSWEDFALMLLEEE